MKGGRGGVGRFPLEKGVRGIADGLLLEPRHPRPQELLGGLLVLATLPKSTQPSHTQAMGVPK